MLISAEKKFAKMEGYKKKLMTVMYPCISWNFLQYLILPDFNMMASKLIPEFALSWFRQKVS